MKAHQSVKTDGDGRFKLECELYSPRPADSGDRFQSQAGWDRDDPGRRV